MNHQHEAVKKYIIQTNYFMMIGLNIAKLEIFRREP